MNQPSGVSTEIQRLNNDRGQKASLKKCVCGNSG